MSRILPIFFGAGCMRGANFVHSRVLLAVRHLTVGAQAMRSINGEKTEPHTVAGRDPRASRAGQAVLSRYRAIAFSRATGGVRSARVPFGICRVTVLPSGLQRRSGRGRAVGFGEETAGGVPRFSSASPSLETWGRGIPSMPLFRGEGPIPTGLPVLWFLLFLLSLHRVPAVIQSLRAFPALFLATAVGPGKHAGRVISSLQPSGSWEPAVAEPALTPVRSGGPPG